MKRKWQNQICVSTRKPKYHFGNVKTTYCQPQMTSWTKVFVQKYQHSIFLGLRLVLSAVTRTSDTDKSSNRVFFGFGSESESFESDFIHAYAVPNLLPFGVGARLSSYLIGGWVIGKFIWRSQAWHTRSNLTTGEQSRILPPTWFRINVDWLVLHIRWGQYNVYTKCSQWHGTEHLIFLVGLLIRQDQKFWI